MQWQRVILSVFISAMVFTGCEDFPIVEQPVTNLTVGLVTGLGGVTDSCQCDSATVGGLDRLVGLIAKRSQRNEFGLARGRDEPQTAWLKHRHEGIDQSESLGSCSRPSACMTLKVFPLRLLSI